ncbi:MAG: cytochrome P450 [Chloroflexota bacterium]
MDTIINNTRPDGKPFTPADLVSLAVGPFFAGMDTLASTMAFYLLALLKQPQLLEDAKAEVDEFFRDGIPSLHEFRKLEILHAAGIETLRRYPVTPFTPRVVKEDFEFEGYHIPAGTEVMFAQTVTHFLPEFYPEPEKFDASRFMGDNRNRQANVFTPFTVGAHSCLGAGLAEIQMLVTMAALLHKVDFDSLPDSFAIKIHTQPLPNPGDVKVRVKGLRH